MNNFTLNVIHSIAPGSLEILRGLFAVPTTPRTTIAPVTPTPVQQPTQPQSLTQTPVAQAAQLPTAIPTQPAAAPTAPQQPSTIPTSEPTYTHDQVSLAAAVFAEASEANRQTVLNLLGQFGAQMLHQLPVEQPGAFATALRAAGANI